MAVEQGQLDATDTTKDMEDFYSDSIVSSVAEVNRIIHNDTQFIRLLLQRPKPVTATRGAVSAPDSQTSTPHYIDGLFAENTRSGIDLMIIGFSSGQQVKSTQIKVYSAQTIDDDDGKWEVATSIDGTNAQFETAGLKGTTLTATESTPVSPGGFLYTLDFTAPASAPNGLRYWRIKHADGGAFDNVTEVEIVEPLSPTISYFGTDGNLASSKTFEEVSGSADILDACWDTVNDRFYTIRFNDVTVGSTTITLDDDFGDADAGTASGTNNFNTGRWIESNINDQFIRLNNQLSYNVSSGKGQLETTYTLAGNLNLDLLVQAKAVNSQDEWLAVRALDEDNKTVMSEGIGWIDSPTTSGVWFASRIDNFVDSVGNCDLVDVRPLWHNTTSGTDSFEITFSSGSTWTVTGTLSPTLANATTGVDYNESVEPNTPIEFNISCTAAPSPGQKFTFDLVTDHIFRNPATSGVIGLNRTGSTFTTKKVYSTPQSTTSDDVSIEIFGSTGGSINIVADDFVVGTGTGTFSDVAVFTVERRNSDGEVIGSPLISSFDVIGNPSLNYNDFLGGRVQIAATSSGTAGGQFVYIKVNDTLYKYTASATLPTEDGSNSLVSAGGVSGQIAKDGTHSLQWTKRSGVQGTPFLTYIEFNDTLNQVKLRTINHETLQDTTDDREIFFKISDYDEDTLPYRIFYDQNDFDTTYYVDSSKNLQAWNIDDRISAFIAVNALDVTLPAGTTQDTPVNADVINAWGEAKNGKTVTFAVTAGDGAVSPSSVVTTGTAPNAGRATTTFTVGSTVGVSTITATVTEV